jgi:hypothetical protein
LKHGKARPFPRGILQDLVLPNQQTQVDDHHQQDSQKGKHYG